MTMSLYGLLTVVRTEKCSSSCCCCCCSSRFSCVVLESWRALGRKGGGSEHELLHFRIRLLVALARKVKEMQEEEDEDDNVEEEEEEEEICLKEKEKAGRGSEGRK